MQFLAISYREGQSDTAQRWRSSRLFQWEQMHSPALAVTIPDTPNATNSGESPAGWDVFSCNRRGQLVFSLQSLHRAIAVSKLSAQQRPQKL